MFISLIAAMDRRGLIGNGTGMPWHLPSDLRRFRTLTLGKPVIMGRRTFASIGKPLPGRCNIVLTRDPEYRAPGGRVVRSFEEALAVAAEFLATSHGEEVMVIGGATVYAEAMDRWDRLYLTIVEGQFKGNTHFPMRLLLRQPWRSMAPAQRHAADEANRHGHSFYVIERTWNAPAGPSSRWVADLAEHETRATARPVLCAIWPRRDATTEQLRELGSAITAWVHRALRDSGILIAVDHDALLRLRLGEPPSPRDSRIAQGQPNTGRECLGERGANRSWRFAIEDAPHGARDAVIESMRATIPSTLVEDILVGDRSWTE